MKLKHEAGGPPEAQAVSMPRMGGIVCTLCAGVRALELIESFPQAGFWGQHVPRPSGRW